MTQRSNKKKYTSQDWLHGKIYLDTCPVRFHYSEQKNIGTRISWTDLDASERDKIRAMQKENYDAIYNDLLNRFKTHFTARYKRSEFKPILLQDEVQDFHKLLFDERILSYLLIGRHHILQYEENDFKVIKQYVNDVIIGGKEKTYDFIHSKNYSYQENKTPSRLYAQVCYDYYQWLIKSPVGTKPKKEENRTLKDIWIKDKDPRYIIYDKYIDFLKMEYNEIQSSFIEIVHAKMYWKKIPQKGWQQYLSAFVNTCIRNKCIQGEFSSTQWLDILVNTFNVKPNSKSFKSISVTIPKEKYKLPFISLPKMN